MRRIKAACIEQTIHFTAKDQEMQNKASIERDTRKEYEDYKVSLERKRVKFKLVEESPQDDGSLIIKLKRQYNQYNCGDYLSGEL